MRFPAALLLACALAALATTAFAAETVEIRQGDMSLRAVLFRPTGEGPFPAVVAMHGCGGLSDRSGPITTRFAEWGERLLAQGFVVLFPDSFGSRGLGSQCTNKKRTVRPSRERVQDANTARTWLQGQPWVKPEHVSLMGWSNGASSTLWTVRDRGTKPPDADFRSAVALYPGCRTLQEAAWSARVPTLLLVGAADDWTPAQPCREMVDNARGRTAQASIVTYPGAYHDFDRANYPVRQRKNLAFTANGTGIAHLGTNEAARADAIKRVPQWLAR